MQEEVEQRIVSLMISCGKLGEQEFRKAIAKLLEQLKNDRQKHQYSKANPHGKMTVKQLAAKDKGLQSIEVTDQNIGSFNRIARKYGIDFAPFKVKGEKRYMVFFKAPDADAMTAAFKEYTAKQVRKAERPSVLEKLQHFKSLIQAAVVDRTKRKELERGSKATSKSSFFPIFRMCSSHCWPPRSARRCGWLPVQTLRRSC